MTMAWIDYNVAMAWIDYNVAMAWTDYNVAMAWIDYNVAMAWTDYNVAMAWIDYNVAMAWIDYNVAMAWTDYKKAYVIPKTWIIECLKMFTISEKNRTLHYESYGKLESGTNSRKINLTRGKKNSKDLFSKLTQSHHDYL